jgi:hypothetical protein
MRILLTGLDENRRSTVLRELDASDFSTTLYQHASAPQLPPRGATAFRDLHVPPGGVRWTVLNFAPNTEFELHETDSVDLDVVVAGSIDLVLETGTHHLDAGDGVVIAGVAHGWRVGCTFSVVLLGASPDPGDPPRPAS